MSGPLFFCAVCRCGCRGLSRPLSSDGHEGVGAGVGGFGARAGVDEAFGVDDGDGVVVGGLALTAGGGGQGLGQGAQPVGGLNPVCVGCVAGGGAVGGGQVVVAVARALGAGARGEGLGWWEVSGCVGQDLDLCAAAQAASAQGADEHGGRVRVRGGWWGWIG